MKESPILIPSPVLVDFLIPDDAAVRGGDIHQFYPEGVAYEVVGEHCGALEAGVGPSCAVWVGDVQFCDGHRLDFVRSFGDGAFDGLLVFFREDGRHFRKGRRDVEGGGGYWLVEVREALRG